MGKRSEEKHETRQRIVAAASRLVRKEGIAGLKVTDVMAAAGLTHGAFYAHFADKNELIEAAFHDAFDHRETWIGSARKRTSEERLSHLLNTYLTPKHRDTPEQGCAFAALAREFAQAGGAFPKTFEEELGVSFTRLTELLEDETESNARQTAMGMLSLCVGGMVLARAVEDPKLSNDVLKAARAFGQDAHTKKLRTT
ncbi:MAG: TetR/AcrR family transcriptional regulator [Rhodobiaceae bacterium]|nr:HTH-type transcriptional regulator TtgR [Rhodobiaceae bacterium]MCR9242731.1 TetR/AcrR family transcriptional regulator [Rhodobiaceae bacterium]